MLEFVPVIPLFRRTALSWGQVDDLARPCFKKERKKQSRDRSSMFSQQYNSKTITQSEGLKFKLPLGHLLGIWLYFTKYKGEHRDTRHKTFCPNSLEYFPITFFFRVLLVWEGGWDQRMALEPIWTNSEAQDPSAEGLWVVGQPHLPMASCRDLPHPWETVPEPLVCTWNWSLQTTVLL